METNPLCEHCDLQNSEIDPVFCPDETAMHILEDCSEFSMLRINYFQEFKLNFEELVNSKTPLLTTLHKKVKFFKRTGCFKKSQDSLHQYHQKDHKDNYISMCIVLPDTILGLGFALCAQPNTVSTSCRSSTRGI